MANKTTKTEKPEAVAEEVKEVAEELDKDAIIKQLMEEVAELKNAISAKATEPETEQEAEQPAPPVDEWEEYIDVVVPRHGRGQEKCFFVAINGRNAQIPANGQLQRLRKPHALALLDSLMQEAKAEQFAEDLPHEGAPASFADLMAVINDLRSKLRAQGMNI